MSQEPLSTWATNPRARFCARPWNEITVLADGTAVCACIDAGKSNPLGNVIDDGLAGVWNGAGYARLRRAIEEDIDQTKVCRGCPHRIESPPPPGYHTNVPLPQVLYVENFAGCNLACPGCDRASIEGTRDGLRMSFADYERIIDELSPNLRYMEFHVGGENWIHPQAAQMVRLCKDRNPGCTILTSTNGYFFRTEEKAEAAVRSGIDCIIVSIDGARQSSYSRYRVGGEIEEVFESSRRLIEARNRFGPQGPTIVWRYILFDWNSSREEMDEARRMSRELGFDALAWHLNAVGEIASSKRYYIGSPHLPEIAGELWDTFVSRQGSTFELDHAAIPAPLPVTPTAGEGEVSAARREARATVERLDREIAEAPETAALYRDRGRAWLVLGDLQSAIENLDKALSLNPRDAVAFRHRGEAWISRGDLDTAIDNLDRAIELAPKNVEGFMARGLARSRRGDLDGASADHEWAVGLRPNHARAYLACARDWRDRGDLERSRAFAGRALSLDPNLVEARALAGDGEGALRT